MCHPGILPRNAGTARRTEFQIKPIRQQPSVSSPAAQPIKQGNAPGNAPTSTAIEFTFFNGV